MTERAQDAEGSASPEERVTEAAEQAGGSAVSAVRVAALQFDTQVGVERRARNVQHGLELAAEAVAGGATLVVMPELANTGYTFADRQEAYAHAEPVPDGNGPHVGGLRADRTPRAPASPVHHRARRAAALRHRRPHRADRLRRPVPQDAPLEPRETVVHPGR